MASSSRADDVQVALQRAKTKISNLQLQLDAKETSAEETSPSWTPSKELQDSLVDMYQANPRVNVELRQCLTSPAAQQLSSPVRSWTSLSLDNPEQASQHLMNHPSSCSPSPLSIRRSVSQSSFRPPGGGRQMELDLSPSRGPSPWTESCADLHDGGGGSRGPGSPVPRRHLVRSDDSSHPEVLCGPITASGRLQTFDRDKNISFLLKELEGLRETNKKLQEELVQKEKELQRKEVEEELREEQREARSWERPAAVLKEVLSAQRDRDQALMSRLLLANEERDEALLYVRQLQRLENVPLQGADMDVDELLQRVCDADSVKEVQQFGSVLVQRLLLARQRRNDITAQEMKAMMEERDESTARFKRLEQEVMQEREQRTSEMEPLRERGGTHEDILEAESNVLRANDSSQDLLTLQAPPLQVQQLLKEKQSVEAELQCCQEAEREASERVRRLERLVEVLRKKVGTGSLRAVM